MEVEGVHDNFQEMRTIDCTSNLGMSRKGITLSSLGRYITKGGKEGFSLKTSSRTKEGKITGISQKKATGCPTPSCSGAQRKY